MDTDLVGKTEYFIPRTITSLKTVEINNQNLTLLSGSFQKTLKTTWEDISGKQFEIEKKDYDTEMGNYLLFVNTTGNIVKSLATRISSFVVSRKESIVVCGKNSQFECEEISLKRNMETINKLSSNFLDYCNTSVIYSVVGDEEEIYAAGNYQNCNSRLPGVFIQAFNSYLRDALWTVSMNASSVSFISLSLNSKIISSGFEFTGLIADISNQTYESRSLNLLLQQFNGTVVSQTCYGILFSNSSVCSGHGKCQSFNYCVCDRGYFGNDCSTFTCFGKTDGEGACNNGTCVDLDKCQCDMNYYGDNCSIKNCFGLLSNDTRVCGGRGICEDFNECKCDDGYDGSNCSYIKCFDFSTESPQKVCGGRGKCVSPNNCSCDENYFGRNCEMTTCFGISSDNKTVCSFGTCYDYNLCKCTPNRGGEDCSIPYCFGLLATSPSVCNGNGTCVNENICICDKFEHGLPQFIGDQCDIPICFGESSISSSVCSGQGKCVGPNKCECFKGFSGNVCSVDDELLKKIVIPISVIIFILVVLLGIGLLIYIYRNSQWNKRKRVEAELERKLLDFELQLESNMVNSNSSYIIPMEELELIKKIGEGGFGSVYLAKWKQTTVAVKCVHVNSNLEEEEEDTFEKEVMLLNSLKHPNVIQFFGISVTETKKFMVMEYLEGGSLDKIIYELRIKKRKLSLKKKLEILLHVSNGMSYLHNLKPKSIIHRDLKCANILMDENMQPKVCDFGLSKLIGNNNSSMTTNLGSILYMAPELIGDENQKITNKLDVYSFGIIMYEFFFEENPFLNSQSQKIHKFSPPEITDINNFSIPLRVVKGFRPKIPFRNKTEQEQWTKEFLDSENIKETIQLTDQYFELMIKCWDGNSSNRPSFDDISDYLSKMLFWN